MDVSVAAGPAPVEARTGIAVAARAALVMRYVALLIDLAILGVIALGVNATFGVDTVTSGSLPPPGYSGFSHYSYNTLVPWPVLVAVSTAYFALFEVLFAATPGKRAVNLRVLRSDGRRASMSLLLLRNLLRPIDMLAFYVYVFVLSFPVIGIGHLLVLITRLKQRLGDMAAGTVVVSAAAVEIPLEPRRRRLAKLALVGAIVAAAMVVMMTFEYYGRPPLVIQGAQNTGYAGLARTVGPIRLGKAAWGGDTLNYPVTLTDEHGVHCTGIVRLQWDGFARGWQLSGMETRCPV